MKIERIEFIGFKSNARRAFVDFSDSNVTVIYGDNGCGKTSFLKAIGAFLSHDSKTLVEIGINKVFCQVSNDGQQYAIEVFKNGDGTFNWSGLDESILSNSKSLSLGVERGVSMQAAPVEADTLLDFFMENPTYRELIFGRNTGASVRSAKGNMANLAAELSLFIKRRNAIKSRARRLEIEYDKNHLYLQSIKMENIEGLLLQKYRTANFIATKRIQSALFDTLSLVININDSDYPNNELMYRTGNYSPPLNFGAPMIGHVGQLVPSSNFFLTDLAANKDRIIEALDDNEDNTFKNTIISILSDIESLETRTKVMGNKVLLQLFKNMLKELDVEKVILGSIIYLVDKFNEYLIDDKKLVVNSHEVYIDIDGVKHSIDELSSGERHILTLLTLVLFEAHHRDFLIIDEPEISLNVKWQRGLMSIFSELVPDVQIIVASHSPSLAHKTPNYLRKLEVCPI